MSKKWNVLMQLLQGISKINLVLGGVLYLNDNLYGKWVLSIGGVFYAIYNFLLVFEKIHREPRWELVYPELASGMTTKKHEPNENTTD